MIHVFRICVLAISIVCVANSPCISQQSETVASVDGNPITLNEVHYFLDRTLKNLPGQSDRESRSKEVIALGVDYCINRALVLEHIRKGKFKTTEQEVRFQIEELTASLNKTNQSLDEHLREIRLTESEFRRELEWLTSWQNYVRQYVTPEHLKSQFDKHKERYDGRRIKVAQIFWKDSDSETVKLAKEVRNEIVSGAKTWKDAVQLYSQSASAKENGNLGWIEFSGPMPPKFNEETFTLAANELSRPFVTSFGTHLVKCIEIKSGNLNFEQVAEKVRSDETNRLFELVANKNRDDKKIVKNRAFQIKQK